MAVGTAKRENLGGQLADWVTGWLFNYKSDRIIVLGDWIILSQDKGTVGFVGMGRKGLRLRQIH